MPEQLYRIGDAAKLLALKPYVLRYWETEFSQIRPVRTGKGQRRYTESDMAALRRIKYLLHEQGMTIEGARKVLTGASSLSMTEDPASCFLKDTAAREQEQSPSSPSGMQNECPPHVPAAREKRAQPASPMPSEARLEPMEPSVPSDASDTVAAPSSHSKKAPKERLVQLSLVDFVIPKQLDSQAAAGTPINKVLGSEAALAEQKTVRTHSSATGSGQHDDTEGQVVEQGRLKQITAELRALQSLLRRD